MHLNKHLKLRVAQAIFMIGFSVHLNKHLKLHVTNIVSDNFSLLKSATNQFLSLKLKSLTHVQS